MVRNGELAAEDAKRVLRRYWWILPITVVGCGTIAMMLAMVLPKKYTSQTLILVQQPAVPSDIVKPVVTEDLNHRLASMQEQILSRTRLEPIIEKFGLYRNFVEKYTSKIWLSDFGPLLWSHRSCPCREPKTKACPVSM